MACTNCKKKIDNNFLCVNVGGGLVDKKKTSTAIPKGNKLIIWFDIMSHSDEKKKYKGKDLFEKGIKSSWALQMEDYFCSKECFIKWIEKQIEKIPNP